MGLWTKRFTLAGRKKRVSSRVVGYLIGSTSAALKSCCEGGWKSISTDSRVMSLRDILMLKPCEMRSLLIFWGTQSSISSGSWTFAKRIAWPSELPLIARFGVI